MRNAILTALLLLLVVASCSSGPPVGFYDVDRVAAESKVAREMLAAAEKDEAAVAKKVAAEKAIAEFRAVEKTPLAPEQLERRQQETQVVVDAANKELRRARQDAAKKVDAKTSQLAGRAAVAHHMLIVLSFNGKPPYAEPGCDLTSELIADLDGQTPEVAAAREYARRQDDETAMAAATMALTKTVQQ